uniref:Ig-like domain-containing protein n=1 Tax=Meloidogyne enterolobii TaxID=390850 RepID=A0A6V7Y8X8_MELEN|nr:unnamed protein product [Meloidogyne enterolobii]
MFFAVGPRFMSTNQSKIIERGSETTFKCEVLGNQPPIIRWYHGKEQEKPIQKGAKCFNYQKCARFGGRRIKCIAEEDFPSKTLQHQLYLNGTPKVRFTEYILFENEKAITLICERGGNLLLLNLELKKGLLMKMLLLL